MKATTCLALALQLLVSGCQVALQPTPTTISQPPSPTPMPEASPTPLASPAPTATQAPVADVAYVKAGEIWLASGSQARKLATGGPFTALSWSPNGKMLAAVKGRGFDTELHILDVASGADRSFNLHAYEADRPEWSPDSSMIAFPLVEDRNRNGQLDPQDFGKVAVVRVSDGATSTYDGRWASWHPQKGELLLATMGSFSDAIYRNNSIVSIDLAAGTRSTLMEVKDVPQDLQAEYGYPFGPSTILLAYPQLSPEGSRLAFTALGHTGLVGIMDLASRKLRLYGFLYEGGAGYSTWSPNGRYLAYEGFPASGQGSVGIVDTTTGGERVLGGRPDGGPEDRTLRHPAWSADSTALAVVMAERSSQARIVVIDPSGKELSTVATGNVAWPTWNPARR